MWCAASPASQTTFASLHVPSKPAKRSSIAYSEREATSAGIPRSGMRLVCWQSMIELSCRDPTAHACEYRIVHGVHMRQTLG